MVGLIGRLSIYRYVTGGQLSIYRYVTGGRLSIYRYVTGGRLSIFTTIIHCLELGNLSLCCCRS